MRAIYPIIAFGRCLTLTLLAVTTISCGPHFGFVGQWVGHRSLKGNPDAAPYVVYTMNEVKLTIFNDGRFDLLDFGIPRSGMVAIAGDTAVLTISKIAGIDLKFQSKAVQDAALPLTIKGNSNGTIFYQDAKATDPSQIVLSLKKRDPNDRS